MTRPYLLKQMLTVDDLSGLTWDRFESLVALIVEGKVRQEGLAVPEMSWGRGN